MDLPILPSYEADGCRLWPTALGEHRYPVKPPIPFDPKRKVFDAKIIYRRESPSDWEKHHPCEGHRDFRSHIAADTHRLIRVSGAAIAHAHVDLRISAEPGIAPRPPSMAEAPRLIPLRD